MDDVQRSLSVSSAADAGGECAGRAATIVWRARVCVWCVYVCVCVCGVCMCVVVRGSSEGEVRKARQGEKDSYRGRSRSRSRKKKEDSEGVR